VCNTHDSTVPFFSFTKNLSRERPQLCKYTLSTPAYLGLYIEQLCLSENLNRGGVLRTEYKTREKIAEGKKSTETNLES
jgi:hypothetical protein